MIYHAHVVPANEQEPAVITVRDDRGTPTAHITISRAEADDTDAFETRLREAGWRRSAEWTETDQGWHAPVTAM